MLGQLLQLPSDVRVLISGQVLEQAYDLTGLPVTLSLGDIVVLLPHVHVPSSIGGVGLATVVETRELLVEFLGSPSVDGFPLALFGFRRLRDIVGEDVVHQLRSRFIALHVSLSSVPILV